MATVNTSTLFPSAKFITTSATGELGEVNSSPETSGSITHDGFTLTLNASGVQSPVPSLTVVEDATATGLEFEISGSDITLKAQTIASTPAVSATKDSLSLDGITYDSEVLGDTGLKLTFVESGASDGIAYNSTTKVITITLDDTVLNKTQGDISNIYAVAGGAIKDLIDITITNPATSLTSASQVTDEDFTGGNDEVPEVPATTIASYTQSQVETAFAGADASLQALCTLSIADGGANLSSVKSRTEFNGADAVNADLDANADYILIKRTDLHDLSVTEQNDGRKFLWGILHQAESILNALSSKPENFTLAKGNPTSVNSGTALRQTYTANATYGIANLDLKDEA